MALLTHEQLERIRQIIRDSSTALAITTMGMQVSDDELQRLVDLGYVPAELKPGLILTSFEFGRLLAKLPGAKHMSYPEFQAYLAKNPVELSVAERRAYDVARDRAGQYCVGLGSRYSGELTDEVVPLDAELARRQQEGIQDAVSQSAVKRSTLSELKSNMGHIAEDWARDWGRIASTESHQAHEEGWFESTVERHGESEQMAKIPEPTACADCRRLYLGADGLPAVHPASWWRANGTNNVGRKRNAWKAVLGGMHCWCQCKLVRVPGGWKFDSNWDLLPEDQVEKSRKLARRIEWRGLPISIENDAGDVRYWYDRSARESGQTVMRYPYGYLRMTEGADGDHLDVFVGPHEDAPSVFIVRQRRAPDFTAYDEDKVMLGFLTADDAREAYLCHYTDPRFLGRMDTMEASKFVANVKGGKYRDGEMAKALPPGTVHTWANGQRYEKQGDGSWLPVRSQPAQPQRTGAVKLDQQQVRQAVDQWLDKQKWNRQGVLATKQLDGHDLHLEIAGVDGRQHKVWVIFRPGPEVKDPRGVTGSQQSVNTKFADDHVTIDIVQKPWDRDWLGAEVRSVLSHELTHVADPTHRKRDWKSEDDARQRYAGYVNAPEEVTARLHQVMRELEDKRVATHYYHLRSPRPDTDLLAHSSTWNAIQEHLSPENRRRFLRLAAAVGTRIRSGDTPAFEKAIPGYAGEVAGSRPPVSTMGNAFSPARAPGDNVNPRVAEVAKDHPASPENRKRKKVRRLVLRRPSERYQFMSRTDGGTRATGKHSLEIQRDSNAQRFDTESNRQRFEDERVIRAARLDAQRLVIPK